MATHRPDRPPALTPVKAPNDDGRQSETARRIARGTTRLMASLNAVCLPEISLPNGRRADLVVLDAKGTIWIVEIKSSAADFLTDNKWPDYRTYCDAFYFAVTPDFPIALLPETPGLICADGYGGEILRGDGDAQKLPGARRRAVQLLFARIGAARLMRLSDPDAGLEEGR